MTQRSLSWTPGNFDVAVERRGDGTIFIRPRLQLSSYPVRVTDRLEYWAEYAPERTFVARRDATGAWQRFSYAEVLSRVRSIAAGLAARPLSKERPIAILSGNSIEHLLMALAAMYVGVPHVPVSPPYSQVSSDLGKLRYVLKLLTPGLVVAFGSSKFERAIAEVVDRDVEVIADTSTIAGRAATTLQALEKQGTAEQAESAHASVGPDTIAKFLLTSGSTGQPKAVITTQRMLCSNQIMLLQAVPFVSEEPPVVVDWLPWNHTYGGSHNVGLVLFNGGSLYIDEGKPTPGAFETTVRNLKEISPTVYFNVPKGYELLAQRMATDVDLRNSFFRRLRACFFAGAGLPQHVWDALDEQAMATSKIRVPILSGLGSTECSPSVTFTTPANDRAGVIGLPAAGNELKLAPCADKLELRVRGPNVTPGYWRQPELTAAAFDEEGYYRLGDAVRLLKDADPAQGLLFDGRIAEDFKLSTGTWVSVGPLRAHLLTALAPLVQDVVIAGLNQDYLSILIFPEWTACAAVAQSSDAKAFAQIAASPALRLEMQRRLRSLGEQYPSSSMRVERALLLVEPPSLDKGEITDKGSINQRAVLRHREALVAALYEPAPSLAVISAGQVS